MSIETLNRQLSQLESQRDSKRQRLECLFEEMQKTKRQMESLEGELHILDDKIDNISGKIRDMEKGYGTQTQMDGTQSQAMTQNTATVELDEMETKGNETTENATSKPACTTQTQMDEHLTEPDYDENSPFDSNPPPNIPGLKKSGSIIGGIKPLEMNKKNLPGVNPYSSTQKKVVHAMPPAGLMKSSRGKGTIESYFSTTQEEKKFDESQKQRKSQDPPSIMKRHTSLTSMPRNPYKSSNNNSMMRNSIDKANEMSSTTAMMPNHLRAPPPPPGPAPFDDDFDKGYHSDEPPGPPEPPNAYEPPGPAPFDDDFDKGYHSDEPPGPPEPPNAYEYEPPQNHSVSTITNPYNSLAPPTSLFAQHPPQHHRSSQNQNMTSQILSILQNTFHIPSFRNNQQEIITATLSNQDCFVIMRTGGGKSLTYQLPAVYDGRITSNKLTVVVSPLLSLIHDQERQMNSFVPNSAVSLTSATKDPPAVTWNRLRDPRGGVVMVLVTPEKIHQSQRFKSEMERWHDEGRLARFVIDEAHCATQWGHDFRPDYTKLGILKTHFPRVPLIALTATASDRVREDCVRILRLERGYKFFRSSANRTNLRYQVREKREGRFLLTDMMEFINTTHPKGAGIIYTFSRKEADEVAAQLCSCGISAMSYHSSVKEKRKAKVHESWMRNETQVVVATIAFGLGINKPDVRFVLHHSLSKSLEGYYQESGRAGRDGKPADCVLYYSTKDVARTLCMIHGNNSEKSFWSMVRYAQENGNDAVCRDTILRCLGEHPTVTPINDNVDERNVTSHAITLTKLVMDFQMHKERCTMTSLVKTWRSKKDDHPCVRGNPPWKDLTKDECDRLIISLIINDILHPKIVFNKYSSNMYIIPGPSASTLINSRNPTVAVVFPLRAKKTSSQTAALTHAPPPPQPPPPPPTSSNTGWISSSRTRQTPSAARTKTTTTTKNTTSKIKKRNKRKSEIIELLESENDDDGISSASTPSQKKRKVLRKGGGRRIKRNREPLEIKDSDSDEDFL